ncbi:hypothetical protein [Clostridium tagluense]|uniref:hypothetical protein n=1 Tax=Clostridium tagluense TaxID=360422 RepID=UPI001C0CDBB7|nr:hypothetical protein [Clostridium tagluense]MBU3126074.1 hypothetical protein [Clostridium tagluense]
MTNIKSEYTKLDKENQIIELTYYMNTEVSKIIFDLKNDKINVSGSLYNLIGYQDSEEDKRKYEEFLKTQKELAKERLNKI